MDEESEQETMRPIDANDTIKKIIALGEQLDQHDRAVILMVALYLNNVNDIPTIDTSGNDQEITEESVKEYCRKRCLMIVTSDLYDEMMKRWSGRRTAHWKHIAPSCWQCDCCGCVVVKVSMFCPDCGCGMEKE